MRLPFDEFKASLDPNKFRIYRNYLYWKTHATEELSQPEVVHEEAKRRMQKLEEKFRKNSYLFDPGKQLTVKIENHEIRNPIVLAAGFDKNCEVLGPTSHLFGILTPGSVRLDAYGGNEQTRMIVDNKRERIINAQGYPHYGLDFTTRQLQEFHNSPKGNAKILLNFTGITTNYTEDAVLDACKEIIVKTNTSFGYEESRSSPNTDFNKQIQTPEFTKKVMDVLNTHVSGKLKSSKIGPYSQLPPSEAEIENKMKMIKTFYENGGELIALNNTRPIDTKQDKLTKDFARPVAGESGRPLLPYTLRLVEDVHQRFPELKIIAGGGVFDGRDVIELYRRGATFVSAFSVFTFYGFGKIIEFHKSLKQFLGEETLASYIEKRDARFRR